jgi:2-methylcitrate dehydratase PrpD
MGPTQQVAEFISSAQFDDLPVAAHDRATSAIVDYFACAAAGSRQPTGRKVLTFVREIGGSPVSSIVGAPDRTSAPNAALVNGTFGHVLDYDDVNWRMIGHPGVSILPAVLALAEGRHSSGKDVILAYSVGFEVVSKLGAMVNNAHYEHGWHATGTLGTIGAAAGAAKILGLDMEGCAAALGIAASLAGGIRQNFGTDTKPFHAGRAAQNGVTAAMLAAGGFSADQHILEAEWGFFKVFAGELNDDGSELHRRLGQPWDIVELGFLTKNYPSCGSTHPAIDGMLSLSQRHRFSADDVAGIETGVVRLTPKILIHDDPSTPLEAKFSMPFCVAAALVTGSVGLRTFSDDVVHDPAIRSVMPKVSMFVDPAVDDDWRAGQPRPVIVRVKLNDGTVVEERVDFPRGMPQNPLAPSDLEAKFRDCALETLGEERVVESLAALRNLADVPDVCDITALFAVADRPAVAV